jgi:chorismate synthase
VAAGAVARKLISREGIQVWAYTKELAGISAKRVIREDIEKNPLFCPDSEAAEKMGEVLDRIRESGDSVGGIVEIRVQGCPPGLGEPVFDKLDADLAKALMSIGTVKGVEIGAGFEAARMRGSENNDPINPQGFLSNHAGGILAGISNGEEIVIRVACKPIASIRKEQETVDTSGNPVKISISGRHDISVIPRIVPVCEAMTCMVLADHVLRQRAIR